MGRDVKAKPLKVDLSWAEDSQLWEEFSSRMDCAVVAFSKECRGEPGNTTLNVWWKGGTPAASGLTYFAQEKLSRNLSKMATGEE